MTLIFEQAAKPLNVAQRAKLLAGYRERWRKRLWDVLTAEWMLSVDIAAALCETNAKVLERLSDLVKEGGAQRAVQRRPNRRKSSSVGPFYAYFRLNVSGKVPSLPPLPFEPPNVGRRGRHPRRGAARPFVAYAAPPIPGQSTPASSAIDELGPAVIEVSMALSAADRHEIVARYRQSRDIDARFDRVLLAACGHRLGRPLMAAEKSMMRRAFVTLAGWSP